MLFYFLNFQFNYILGLNSTFLNEQITVSISTYWDMNILSCWVIVTINKNLKALPETPPNLRYRHTLFLKTIFYSKTNCFIIITVSRYEIRKCTLLKLFTQFLTKKYALSIWVLVFRYNPCGNQKCFWWYFWYRNLLLSLSQHLYVLWGPDSANGSTPYETIGNRSIGSGVCWVSGVVSFQPDMAYRNLEWMIKYSAVGQFKMIQ